MLLCFLFCLSKPYFSILTRFFMLCVFLFFLSFYWFAVGVFPVYFLRLLSLNFLFILLFIFSKHCLLSVNFFGVSQNLSIDNMVYILPSNTSKACDALFFNILYFSMYFYTFSKKPVKPYFSTQKNFFAVLVCMYIHCIFMHFEHNIGKMRGNIEKSILTAFLAYMCQTCFFIIYTKKKFLFVHIV